MRLDHIAYRTNDRNSAAKFFMKLGYKLEEGLPEGFDIQFEDGTSAKCLVLVPDVSADVELFLPFSGPGVSTTKHDPPEIFVSDGSSSSIVSDWVKTNGPGIHHLAYEVSSIEEKMIEWEKDGVTFTTSSPIECPGLRQIFTHPHPVTGIIYELIERTTVGFCRDNVKELMNSTKKDDSDANSQ